MRFAPVLILLATAVCPAADLEHLPANTWVEIKYKTVQPADPTEKGNFAPQGWNKIVYDPDGQRVLFYDRWINKKHGDWTIYGNCLFGFDAAAGQLTPIKIDNWTKIDVRGGWRTLALPRNDHEPTPCPRHVYHAFEYVSELKAVFICNGANQTALNKEGKLVGHDLCDGSWRLDLKTNRWTKLDTTRNPPNFLDDSMAYCPDTKSMIYSGNSRQLWILDPAKGDWRKAKESPPRRPSCGQTIFYDPSQRRILLLGGGPLDGWKKGKAAGEFRELYAFDPKTEKVKKLADGPTAFYESHLAYDRKKKLFVAVAVFDKGEQPSGIFAYDPRKDTWHEIKSANPIPPHKNWFGWMQLCYDSQNDCLIGKVNEQFFAFRHLPGK